MLAKVKLDFISGPKLSDLEMMRNFENAEELIGTNSIHLKMIKASPLRSSILNIYEFI